MKKTNKQVILLLFVVVLVILNMVGFNLITVFSNDPVVIITGIISVVLLVLIDILAFYLIIINYYDEK